MQVWAPCCHRCLVVTVTVGLVAWVDSELCCLLDCSQMEGLADAFKRVNPDNIAEVEVTVGSDGARHYLRSIFIFAAAVKMANAGDGRLLRACLFADATFTKLLTWLADQHATESVSPSLSACLLPPQCRVAALELCQVVVVLVLCIGPTACSCPRSTAR